MTDAVERLEKLGQAGFVVSIVYGPRGSDEPGYSVDVLNRAGESFSLPYAANDFAHAISIAENEIRERKSIAH